MFQKKNNGTWSNIETVKKKINGAWSSCKEVQKKNNGVWSIIWLPSKNLVINDPGGSYGVSKKTTSSGCQIEQSGYADKSGKPYFDFYLRTGHKLSFNYSATLYDATWLYSTGYINIEVDSKTYQISNTSSATFSYTATSNKDLRFVIRIYNAKLIIKNAEAIETYGSNSTTHDFI